MTLKEINASAAAVMERIQDAIDPATGEVPAELTAELEALQTSREEKLQNGIRWVINTRAEKKAIKDEIARLRAMYARLDRGESWYVNNYLPSQMEDGETFHCVDGDIKYRHSKGAKITDVDALPDEYVRQVREVNKAEILKALKDGAEIPGAELEERVKRVIV